MARIPIVIPTGPGEAVNRLMVIVYVTGGVVDVGVALGTVVPVAVAVAVAVAVVVAVPVAVAVVLTVVVAVAICVPVGVVVTVAVVVPVAVAVGVLVTVAVPVGRMQGPHPGAWREIREGLVAVAGTPWIWITIVVAALSNIALSGSLEAALPLLVTQHLRGGVGLCGLLNSLDAAGAILIALWLGSRRRLRRRGLITSSGHASDGCDSPAPR